MGNAGSPESLRIHKKRMLTADICEFTLGPVEGRVLTPFEPGAHITVKTPSGGMRRYSLINDGACPDRYVIAVKREPESRGGSISMLDETAEGDTLEFDEPENEFPLVEADKYLLIAGGIGITPIYAIAKNLEKRDKPFSMIYCTRTADDTAYLNEARALSADKVTLHHDYGQLEYAYDFWDVLEKPRKEHVYCCGPKPLMEEIKALSGHWNESQIHFEDFKPAEVVRVDDVPFDVTVANTGQTVHVPADRSILEALRDAGIKTVSSCESGTCGTCRCRLIEGEVDHRDMVLTEQQQSDYLQICISRAISDHLVIEM